MCRDQLLLIVLLSCVGQLFAIKYCNEYISSQVSALPQPPVSYITLVRTLSSSIIKGSSKYKYDLLSLQCSLSPLNSSFAFSCPTSRCTWYLPRRMLSSLPPKPTSSTSTLLVAIPLFTNNPRLSLTGKI